MSVVRPAKRYQSEEWSWLDSLTKAERCLVNLSDKNVQATGIAVSGADSNFSNGPIRLPDVNGVARVQVPADRLNFPVGIAAEFCSHC